MFGKIGLGLLWIGFVSYAFCFAPADRPDTFELIKNLSLGNWQGINPTIVALFNLMGILPMIYACLLFIDGKDQKIKAWPFATGTFFLGAFALLPYLILRQSNPRWHGKKNLFLSITDSRWTGLVLTLGAIALLIQGASGNWQEFAEQWRTSKFINVMSLDFCCLCLLFPVLLKDDLVRRNLNKLVLFWSIALIPLFGPLAYLCLRPPLSENNFEEAQITDDKLVIDR